VIGVVIVLTFALGYVAGFGTIAFAVTRRR
jgi:hypothetical protein